MSVYTYTYRCEVCGEIEEKSHDRNEAVSFTHCGKKMRKVIVSAPSIHFVGVGWGGDNTNRKINE